MTEQYSIAEARHDLAALVRRLEENPAIEITRRGKTVAVLLSLQEYRRITAERKGFFSAYTRFKEAVDLANLEIDPRIFTEGRASETGRNVDL